MAELMKSIMDYDVCTDGTTVGTKQIQDAIDDCASKGVILYFPTGNYMTGTLRLKSNTHIILAGGANLIGSTDLNDYCLDIVGCIEGPKFNRCLLYAEGQENITIEGTGRIDGQGKNFEEMNRPMLMRLVKCKNIILHNIQFRNSAGWCCHFILCVDMFMENLRLYNHAQHNNDGVDLDSCKNVRIIGCNLDTIDDSICLKSTTDVRCENITITGCVISSQTAAVKFGTSSKAGFRNIVITCCTTYQCSMGVFKLLAVDGGIIENVIISDITMDDVASPFFLRVGKRNSQYVSAAEMSHELTTGLEEQQKCHSYIKRVSISNIFANVTTEIKKRAPIMFAGLEDGKIEDVIMNNIHVTFPGGGTLEDAGRVVEELPMSYPEQNYFGVLPAWGFFARHVNGLIMNNVQFDLKEKDQRKMCYFEDVSRLSTDGSIETA